MKGTKRMLALLMTVLMTVASLAAGGIATADEPVTIGFLTLTGTWVDHIQPALDLFTEQTGIQIKMEALPFDQLFQAIEIKLGAASDEYDVISVDVPMVAGYTERGYLKPMDEYFTEEEKANFLSSAIEAGTWKGQFMSPPMNTSSQLLYYNKDLLDAAGVAYPSASVDERLTWDEFKAVAKQVQQACDPDGTLGIMGLMFEQVNRTNQIIAIPNSYGEKSIGDDGLTVDGVMNTPGWVDAMTYYKSLYDEKIAFRGVKADEVSDMFRAGKIAFEIGGTWNLLANQQIEGLNFGVAPHPYKENHHPATPTGSWHFGVTSFAKHPDEAAQFIKFMTLGEGSDIWLDNHGDLPSRIDRLDAIMADTSETIEAVGIKIAAYEAANTAYPRPVTPGYSELDNLLCASLEDISNGADPKDTLDTLVMAITSQMNKYR